MKEERRKIITDGTTDLSITVGGAAKIDGSATVQPVSGTFFQATQPVSGPLTDTQLRATPVPVSGPLTDTQLRATPVPVSGPLTDTQLRASAVPISGTVAVSGFVAVAYPTGTLNNGAETAVAAVAIQVLAANAARNKLLLQNTGAANVRIGTTGVTATTGFRLAAGSSIIIDNPECPINAIFAIREGAVSSTVFAQEIV